jgi:hypothetical protein
VTGDLRERTGIDTGVATGEHPSSRRSEDKGMLGGDSEHAGRHMGDRAAADVEPSIAMEEDLSFAKGVNHGVAVHVELRLAEDKDASVTPQVNDSVAANVERELGTHVGERVSRSVRGLIGYLVHPCHNRREHDQPFGTRPWEPTAEAVAEPFLERDRKAELVMSPAFRLHCKHQRCGWNSRLFVTTCGGAGQAVAQA